MTTVFGSARTEWEHLANPQLAWHSYRQEPVAIRAVTLHSLHWRRQNIGIDKILAWTKCWRRQNTRVNKMLA
jgi:hypothetical protein